MSYSRPECRECDWFHPSNPVMGWCCWHQERRDPQDERAAWCARFEPLKEKAE